MPILYARFIWGLCLSGGQVVPCGIEGKDRRERVVSPIMLDKLVHNRWPRVGAALFGSLLAQFCARKMRMIATIFLLLSVVALVPGLGLYRCMEQLGHQQYALGAQTGILTMAGILMMALGIGVGSFLFKLVVSGTKKIMPGGKQK